MADFYKKALPRPKKIHKFTASMSANTMIISGYIGDIDCDDDGNVIQNNTGQGLVRRFEEMLESMPKEVNIIFRSCWGGSVFDGLPLANRMLAAAANGLVINTIIEGIAASMAGFIYLHGTNRKIDRLSRWHVHRPTNFVAGNYEDLLAAAENTKTLEADIIERIAERTGQTVEFVTQNWCNGPDHELGAKDCIKYGIATEIIESTELPTDADEILEEYEGVEMKARHLLARMQHNPQPNPEMFTEDFKTGIGLTADATDEQVTARIEALKKAETDLTAMQAQKDAEVKAELDGIVNKAKTDGLITEAEVPSYVEMAKKVGKTQMVAVFEKMKPHTTIMQHLGNPTPGNPDGEELSQLSQMSYDQLVDAKKLGRLKELSPESYEMKLKAKFPTA